MLGGVFDRNSYQRWIWINALGYTLCFGIESLLIFARHAILTDYPVIFSEKTQVGILVRLLDLPVFLLGTFLIAWLQWKILRQAFGISAWWIPATAVGLVIGFWGMQSVQLGFMSSGSNDNEMTVGLILLGIPFCSLSLVLCGIFQWLTMRSRVPKAWLWMVFSPVALFASDVTMLYVSMRILGMYFYSSGDPGSEALSRLSNFFLHNGLPWSRHIPWLDVSIELLIAGIAGGVVYGLISGKVLLKLYTYLSPESKSPLVSESTPV